MVFPLLGQQKLKNGTNQGVWEVDFYTEHPPSAQIAADKLSVNCTNNTVQFYNHSAMKNLGQEFERAKSGIGHPGTAAPFGVYKTKDKYISIAIATLELLAEVLEDETIATNYKDDGPRGAFGSQIQFTKRDEIFNHIEKRTKEYTSEYLLNTLFFKKKPRRFFFKRI